MSVSFSCCGITCGSDKKKLEARVGQKDIGAVYDRIAPIYDVWGKLTETRARNRAIALADIKDGQSILEVAVGTGIAFCEILRRNPGGRNIGIDLSQCWQRPNSAPEDFPLQAIPWRSGLLSI